MTPADLQILLRTGEAPERSRARYHHRIIKAAAYGTASVLALLLLTAALPPMVADESDRAILDARVSLLTSPIAGDVTSVTTAGQAEARPGTLLASVTNNRVDETTLFALASKAAELREKVADAAKKTDADRTYLDTLGKELTAERTALVAQLTQRIAALQANVDSKTADEQTKAALNDRRKKLLARDVVSKDMLTPGLHELAGAESLRSAAVADLAAVNAQLAAVKRGIYVGDDLITLATLAQKRRDVALDADRESIEEVTARDALRTTTHLLDQEQARVGRLRSASLTVPENRKLLQVGVAEGRHVNAGDALATLVDCHDLFAVAIFSYREAGQLSVGTRMRVSGEGFAEPIDATVEDIIPKSNEKTDELYAVPFPQTERREMYVIVRPTDHAPLRTDNASGFAGGACPVGKWVTVSRADGWVPSTSMIWHQARDVVVNTMSAIFAPRTAQASAKRATKS